MRYLNILILVAILSLQCATAVAQAEDEKLDMPGDNLNLYSALKLFQESKTLEDFEKSLNDEKSNINNLDLNGDNKIDYIRVVDNPDGDVHNITLKIAVSKTEDQDVAVFVVNKEPDGKVQIQVIGDEDLYGKDYIVEPDFETGADGAGTPNPRLFTKFTGATGTGDRSKYYNHGDIDVAGCTIYFRAQLHHLALTMVLVLLPFLLEAMEALLLALLLWLSLSLELLLQQSLSSMAQLSRAWLARPVLWQFFPVRVAICAYQVQSRRLQEHLFKTTNGQTGGGNV